MPMDPQSERHRRDHGDRHQCSEWEQQHLFAVGERCVRHHRQSDGRETDADSRLSAFVVRGQRSPRTTRAAASAGYSTQW